MVAQAAISLWPQLEATGLTLVSPAVASNAATPGSWLDQFMTQVASGGLRVDAVALHWFGTDFAHPGTSTAQLQANISAVYARYQRPVWLTQVLCRACSKQKYAVLLLYKSIPDLACAQFGLANFATSSFPTSSQQVAFLGERPTALHAPLDA